MIDKSEIYIKDGVSKKNIVKFMSNCKKTKTRVHSFDIIRDGEVMVKIAPKPYSFEYKAQLYSLSKSFTSTAAGFLYDDGILDLEKRIIDIFPDKCPNKISENLSKLKVKHVLSMNTGHESCILPQVMKSSDPVKVFMEQEIKYEPGTHFVYNNAATYLMSIIVGKFAGVSMYDFLTERLFKPLGIKNVYWRKFSDGNQQGAVGLHASTEDIAKLGMLYLNKGVYEGKRIISEEWTNIATSVHSDNSDNGTPDWTAGYGFQFWRNARDGYRGDGAFGQLCLVMTSKNEVFAMQAYSDDMQTEIDNAFAFSEELTDCDNDITMEELEKFVDEYHKPVTYKAIDGKILEKTYKCEKNSLGITYVSFKEDSGSINLVFSDGQCVQEAKFGKDKLVENIITLKCFKPCLAALMATEEKESVHFAGSATYENGVLYLYFDYLDNPHHEVYECTVEGDNILIKNSVKPEFYDSETVKGKLV